jgi:phosphoglucomutase
VKQQWNNILCYYSGRLLDGAQSQFIQTILPFSAYYRHYRVREFDRVNAEKDGKQVDEMRRKAPLFQLSWCPPFVDTTLLEKSITLSFYAMKENKLSPVMKNQWYVTY